MILPTTEDIIKTKADAFKCGLFGVLDLTIKQAEAMRYLTDGTTTQLMYGGAAGGGKAQPLDAMVLTPFGFKPMGSINVGSIIMHPSGANQRVIAVHPQGVKDIYKVSFNDGSSTECCGEHLWQYWHDGIEPKLATTDAISKIIKDGGNVFTPFYNPTIGIIPNTGRKITEIDYVGKKEAKCITVEAIDGLYITDCFIVTHNSYLGCEWLLWNCLSYEGTRWFVARHELAQIRESTIITMNKVFDKHKIPKTFYKYDSISVQLTFYNGSVIKGLQTQVKPSDRDFDRLGSTEYTGGWVEEGAQVAADAYDVLRSRTGRHLNDRYNIKSKVLTTSNPSKNWIYREFYKPFKDGILPDNKKFIHAFVSDNNKIEKGYIENLNSLKGEKRERLLEGNFDYNTDPDQLAEDDAIACIYTNSFIQPDKAKKVLIVDAAMHGSDLFRIGYFEGNVLQEHSFMPKSGGKDILNMIERYRRKYTIPASRIIYDADGVGAFIGSKGGFISGAIPFNGNSAPIEHGADSKKYFNLKSQCSFLLCDDINEYNIFAPCVVDSADIEMLSEELAQIKKMATAQSEKMRIVPKEVVKANIGRSPDFSDIFVMKKYFDILPRLVVQSRGVR